MMEIESFFKSVPQKYHTSSGELIRFLAYYLEKDCKNVRTNALKQCFLDLSIEPYSNIPAYLNAKSKGPSALFIKNKDATYKLNRKTKDDIKRILNETESCVSDDLLSLGLFDSFTPYYIKANAKQMCQCYDNKLYDATLVLMRKLIETLIIECFERFGIDDEIKDKSGNFYFLSDLILSFQNANKINISRNLKQSLAVIKKYGDLSAHNRTFLARKGDIDAIKFELRQTIQEIVLKIDYQNWDKSK